MPITVEKTMRKAERNSITQVGKVKKPIPKWFWGLLIIGGGYAIYSWFTKDKGSGNELSSHNSVQSGSN